MLSTPRGGAAPGVQSQAVLTIATDDSIVSFTRAAFTVTELTPQAMTGVKRLPAKGTLTVAYQPADGTAVAEEDYTPARGFLTFPPGVSSRSFPVPILKESGHATGGTVKLARGAVTGGLLGSPAEAVLTITDSAPAGKVQFGATDYSV